MNLNKKQTKKILEISILLEGNSLPYTHIHTHYTRPQNQEILTKDTQLKWKKSEIVDGEIKPEDTKIM